MRVQKTPAPRTPRARAAPATAPTAYRPRLRLRRRRRRLRRLLHLQRRRRLPPRLRLRRRLLSAERVQVPVSHAAVSVGRGPLTPRLKRVDPPNSQPSTPRDSPALFAPLSPRVVVGAPPRVVAALAETSAPPGLHFVVRWLGAAAAERAAADGSFCYCREARYDDEPQPPPPHGGALRLPNPFALVQLRERPPDASRHLSLSSTASRCGSTAPASRARRSASGRRISTRTPPRRRRAPCKPSMVA